MDEKLIMEKEMEAAEANGDKLHLFSWTPAYRQLCRERAAAMTRWQRIRSYMKVNGTDIRIAWAVVFIVFCAASYLFVESPSFGENQPGGFACILWIISALFLGSKCFQD